MRRIKKRIKKIKVLSGSKDWKAENDCLDNSAWCLFPPSFYQTHTQEEINRITRLTLEKIRSLIDKLE